MSSSARRAGERRGFVAAEAAGNDVKQDCIGRLSIIGDDEDDDIELFRYGQSQRYFIGILENFRGKTRLLNPDIYSRETLKGTQQDGEIVIQNVRPTFAAPIEPPCILFRSVGGLISINRI